MFESILSKITPNLIPDPDIYLTEPPELPDWQETIVKVLESEEIRISTDPEAEVLGDPPVPDLARAVEDSEGPALQMPDTMTGTSDVQYAEAILHEVAHLVCHLNQGSRFESMEGEVECYRLQRRWVKTHNPEHVSEFDDLLLGILDTDVFETVLRTP